MIKKIKQIYFGTGRTSIVIRNLSGSAILKMVNIVISFIMVPITLDYLTKAEYGLWTALSSVLAWFFIFDIGIGNGLRNKYIELKAKNKISEIKSYVSTAYFLFTMLALIIIPIFLIINSFLDFNKLLNAPTDLNESLSMIAAVVFIAMICNFVLKLINTILRADQKNALSDSIGVVAHLISLVGIVILNRTTHSSIFNYALLYTGANLIVTLVMSVVLYSTKYQEIKPSLKLIDLSLSKDLLSVGLRFFFLQIASIIMFQTTSFLMSALIGPESVTLYNISKKYFSIGYMLFEMLTQPLWSGYGDAYHKGDYKWLKITVNRLKKLAVFLIGILIILFIFQKVSFDIWLNGKVEVNYVLSFLLVIYMALRMWNTIFSPFINATGKLKLSMIMLLIKVPLFIPLSIISVKYFDLGLYGVLLTIIFVQAIPSAIIAPIQYKRIMRNDNSIWNK